MRKSIEVIPWYIIAIDETLFTALPAAIQFSFTKCFSLVTLLFAVIGFCLSAGVNLMLYYLFEPEEEVVTKVIERNKEELRKCSFNQLW